ncbi:hypothetical protein [Planktotalea sp.]|uniref:hypothetical protein n=1 Tax=Planktotalea sp. TaxID=2029877 RepID=UPI003D6BEED4
MRRFLGLALKIAGLYLLLLIAYFVFVLASMKNEKLALYERKINPSTFVFWQGGELYSTPPLFSNVMTDAKGQLTSRELDGLRDVDIWVLLLDGFKDIKSVEFASQLGIDVEKVANSKSGHSSRLEGVSLGLRFHPIPVFVNRKSVLIFDAKYLFENYKNECLDEMVYGSMIGQRDQELWDRCKKT